MSLSANACMIRLRSVRYSCLQVPAGIWLKGWQTSWQAFCQDSLGGRHCMLRGDLLLELAQAGARFVVNGFEITCGPA